MMKIMRRIFLGMIGVMVVVLVLLVILVMVVDWMICYYWWGNFECDKWIFVVIDLFQKYYVGIKVLGEIIGWKDYWMKMVIQIVGGNMVDFIQMDYCYFFEYVCCGVLKLFDEYIGKFFMIGDFDFVLLFGGKVDGKFYGLNIGFNSQVFVYNMKVFVDVGIKVDVINWMCEEFLVICEKIIFVIGSKMKGFDDLLIFVDIMQVWVWQNGCEFYDVDGKVMVMVEDIVSFWDYWVEMCKVGVVVGKDKMVVINLLFGEIGIVMGGIVIL